MMKTICILGYPKCVQWTFRSACANMSKGTFSDEKAHAIDIFQVIAHLVNRLIRANSTIISQEIYQNDPFSRVENLKVK